MQNERYQDSPEGIAAARTARLLILSGVRLLRDGLAMILQRRPRVQAVQTMASIELALPAIEAFRPTLILLDVSTEEQLVAARRLAPAAGGTPLLGFAARTDGRHALAYARSGIAGFVGPDASIDELFDAIDRVSRGEFLCSPEIAAMLLRQLSSLTLGAETEGERTPLTVREREIVGFIDRGLSNKQIARNLSIEVSTVKNHVHNILEKLNVTRRGEAAARVRGIG